MKKLINWFVNLYAVWIILAFIIGTLSPNTFLWFTKGSWMTYALSIVMLSMGLTLDVSDFKSLLATPRVVLIAAISQYTIMPLSGWLVAMLLGLPSEFAVGLILVACCPAGSASNMIAYIGRANVALSVISTAVSTLLGIVVTPILCKLLAGQYVNVDAVSMFIDVIKVVLIPVTLGVAIRYKFPKFVDKLGQTGPIVSTWAIIFISGAIIAPVMIEGKDIFIEYAATLSIAAIILHALGFGLGYTLGRLFKYDKAISKAISCETGMQNGGLAAILARNNFPTLMPLAGVPAVFCSIVQTIVGGALATIWRYTSSEDKSDTSKK